MATTWNVWAQLYYGGAWQVLDGDVEDAVEVTLERGVTDDYDLKPGWLKFRLLDDLDVYRPSNTVGPNYGDLRQYSRCAFATGGSVRFTGEVDRYVPDQSDDFQEGPPIKGKRWVDIEGRGTLGRLGRYSDPVTSPMRTQITSYANLRGYWPLEDGKDATRLTQLAPGARTGYAISARFADDDGPAGSAPLVGTTATTSIGGKFATNVSTTGWQVCWVANVGSTDATKSNTFTFRCSNGYFWRWKINNTSYNLLITDSDGVTVKDTSYSYGTGAEPGQWIETRLKCYVSGGSVTIEAGWFPQNSALLYGFTETYAGTSLGRPVDWNWYGGAGTPAANAHVGHVALFTGTTDNLQSFAFQNAFDGYNGERAADRFTRTLDAAGLPYVVLGTASLSTKMGPQPVATVQEIIKECRATEGGMVFDRADNTGIVFALRNYLEAQAIAPVITLNWPSELAPPMREEITTADAFNDVVAKNREGSSARATLSTGPLGVDTMGKVPKTVDVNVNDESELPGIAGWWLNRYTVGGSRYTEITVDLDSTSADLTTVNSIDVGMVIAVAGRTPDLLYLQVLRVAQRSRRHRNVVTFTVAPADVFRVAVYGSTTSRYDVAGSVTVANKGAGTGGTYSATYGTIYVNSPAPGWGTQTPYNIKINGEEMTVTSVFTSGSDQGLNVTRNVNGAGRTHVAGEEVHISAPRRYSYGRG
jgi:hypothetical protein